MSNYALSEGLGSAVSESAAEALAWAFGLGGMACLALWPVFRSLKAMLAVQLCGVTSLSIHYALLGISTAAAVNAIGALQIAIAILWGHRARLRWVGYVLAGLMVATSVLTWQGALSLLSACGMTLVAMGRVQTDAMRMRALVLAGGPFWLVHDILVASPVALADAASLAVGLWQLKQQLRAAATNTDVQLAQHPPPQRRKTAAANDVDVPPLPQAVLTTASGQQLAWLDARQDGRGPQIPDGIAAPQRSGGIFMRTRL